MATVGMTWHDNYHLAERMKKILSVDLTKYMYLCDDVIVGNKKLYDFLSIKKANETFLYVTLMSGGMLEEEIRLMCKWDDGHVYGNTRGDTRVIKKQGLLKKDLIEDSLESKGGYYNYQIMRNFVSAKFVKDCKKEEILSKINASDSDECEGMYSQHAYMCFAVESVTSDIVFKMSSALSSLNELVTEYNNVDLSFFSEL